MKFFAFRLSLLFMLLLITNPTFATIDNGLTFISKIGHNTPAYVEAKNNYLYICTDAFLIFDISNEIPVEIGQCSFSSEFMAELEINGGFAYGAWSKGGIKIFDISNPQNPQLLPQHFQPSFIYYQLNLAYPYLLALAEKISSKVCSIHLIDVSDANSFVLLDSLSIDSGFPHQAYEAKKMILENEYLYLTMGPRAALDAAELHIFKVEAKAQIEYLSHVYLGLCDNTGGMHNGASLSLAKRHSFIYVAGLFDPACDLKIIDVSDPLTPQLVQNWGDGHIKSVDVAVTDNHIYLTNLKSSLIILDVENDTLLAQCDSVRVPMPDYYSQDFELCITGDNAFLNNWDNYAVFIYDISTGSQANYRGLIPFGHDWRDIAVNNNQVFAAIWNCYQLYAIDVTDPFQPAISSRNEVLGWGWGVAAQGQYIYMAMGSETNPSMETGGLTVFEITDAGLVKRAWSPPHRRNHDVQVCVDESEKRAYVLAGQSNAFSENWEHHTSYFPGLRTIDISQLPDQIEEIDSLAVTLPCQGRNLVKFNDQIFIAASDDQNCGLFIYHTGTNQIESEWRPDVVREVYAVAVDSFNIYLGYGNSLLVFKHDDLSNPTANYSLDNTCMDISIQNHSLYVISRSALYAFKTEISGQITLAASYTNRLNSEYRHLAVKDGYVYVLTSNGVQLFSYEAGTGFRDPKSTPDPSSTIVLDQNFPNPFNAATIIRFHLPIAGIVELKLYDVSGREVSRISNGFFEAGEHHITLNMTDVPSGVYFYRIKAGNFVQMKKCVVLR